LVVNLIEELRRDLPNVKNRRDSDAESLQQSMNLHRVLEALDEHSDNDEKPLQTTARGIHRPPGSTPP
jgi:hypothetical protein